MEKIELFMQNLVSIILFLVFNKNYVFAFFFIFFHIIMSLKCTARYSRSNPFFSFGSCSSEWREYCTVNLTMTSASLATTVPMRSPRGKVSATVKLYRDWVNTGPLLLRTTRMLRSAWARLSG